ncbi:DUF2239 family protein [Nannocystis pusilla]|uniref:DUF2239 family protein n=1 Tax=Nannocystis pusilla TaxID=889268 RepID=UPI003B7726FA
MTALAGDLPHYEEAARALFARDSKRFAQQIRRWPADIRDHLARMVEGAFPQETNHELFHADPEPRRAEASTASSRGAPASMSFATPSAASCCSAAA